MLPVRHDDRSAQRATTSCTVCALASPFTVSARFWISAPDGSRSAVAHDPRVYLYCSTVPPASVTVAIHVFPGCGAMRMAFAVQFWALVATYTVASGGVFTGTRTANVTATCALTAPAKGLAATAASNAYPVAGSVRNSTYAPSGISRTAAADATSLRGTPSVPTR